MTTKLVARAEQELPEVLADLRRLVEHETPSSDKQALDAGLDDIERWLTERLGQPAARQRHDNGEHGDVLDVTYSGTAGTVLLLCHYDTVAGGHARGMALHRRRRPHRRSAAWT